MFGARTCVKKMIEQYKYVFGLKPRECISPLMKADHPEIDTSVELDQAYIKVY
jgi:hypothetical protein